MPRLPSAVPGNRSQAAGNKPAACPHRGGLEASSVSASDAGQLLTSVGFLLVPGPPFDRGPAYLMVALRTSPTLSHFDPERIELWTPERRNASQVVLEWPLRTSSARYSWGTIAVIDRLGAVNRFASFGGLLSTVRDRDIDAALFRSDAPILAAGGHSGPADPLGTSAAAFFGILRASAGNDQGLGEMIHAASPNTLYAAFLARSLAVHEARHGQDTMRSRLLSLLRQERCRLGRDAIDDQRRGESLAALISASPAPPTKEAENGRAV